MKSNVLKSAQMEHTPITPTTNVTNATIPVKLAHKMDTIIVNLVKLQDTWRIINAQPNVTLVITKTTVANAASLVTSHVLAVLVTPTEIVMDVRKGTISMDTLASLNAMKECMNHMSTIPVKLVIKLVTLAMVETTINV
jgi:hypothetical protein